MENSIYPDIGLSLHLHPVQQGTPSRYFWCSNLSPPSYQFRVSTSMGIDTPISRRPMLYKSAIRAFIRFDGFHPNHLRISFKLTCSKRNSKQIPIPKKQRAMMSSGILTLPFYDDVDGIDLALILYQLSKEPK